MAVEIRIMIGPFGLTLSGLQSQDERPIMS